MPPISTNCIIFTGNYYTCVARLESTAKPYVWIHDFYCDECQNSSYEKIHGVTHFCIVEAVEVD